MSVCVFFVVGLYWLPVLILRYSIISAYGIFPAGLSCFFAGLCTLLLYFTLLYFTLLCFFLSTFSPSICVLMFTFCFFMFTFIILSFLSSSSRRLISSIISTFFLLQVASLYLICIP